MSDISKLLGLDQNKPLLNMLNNTGQTIALSSAQSVLNSAGVPINLASFTHASVLTTIPLTSLDSTLIQHNGLKTILAALIEGVNMEGLTVAQYITAIETRLDALIDTL